MNKAELEAIQRRTLNAQASLGRRAPGWEKDVLGDGETLHIPMMMKDALPSPTAIFVKDTAVTMTINDALGQIPNQFQFKVMQTIGALAGSGPTARWALDDARGLIMQMEMTALGHYGHGHMTADGAGNAVVFCVDHLRNAIQAAEQRLAGQGF